MNIHAPAKEGAPVDMRARPAFQTFGDEIEGHAKLAVRTSGSQCIFQIGIEPAMLDKIGRPARVLIVGSVQEGMTVSIPDHPHDGLKLSYDGARDLVYVGTGFQARGVSKKPRGIISVRACTDHGKIKISGPIQEWIDAAPIWAPRERRQKDTGAHMRLPARPASGTMRVEADAAPIAPAETKELTEPVVDVLTKPSNGGSVAPHVAASYEIAMLQRLLSDRLNDVRILKEALEQKVGMKLRISQGCQLVVALPGS